MPSEGTDDGGGAGGVPSKDKKDPKDSGSGGHGKNKRQGYQNQNQSRSLTGGPRHTKFEGRCEELKGYIYDCSDARQSDQFTKTTKEIAEYVGRTYKQGGDIRLVVENLELLTFEDPDDPPEDASKAQLHRWTKKLDEVMKRESTLEENVKKVYSLIWGQCTDAMRQRIEALDTFAEMSRKGDGVGLLKALKAAAFNFQSQKNLEHALHESKRRFYMCSQGKYNTTQAYLETFQNTVDVVEHSGGQLGLDPGTIKAILEEKNLNLDDMDDNEIKSLHKEAQEKYLAVAFVLGADRARYGRLIEDLENSYLQGQNNYPTTVTAAYHLLTNWKQDPRNIVRNVGPIGDGVSFTNVDDCSGQGPEAVFTNAGEHKGKTRNKSHITCHKCGKQGHYANECTDGSHETGTALITAGIEAGDFDSSEHFQFLQHETGASMNTAAGGYVPKSWILLDNQSTVDVFHNADLLANIRESKGHLDIHCNAGVASTNLVGELPGYGTVWYHPKGIANILSLSRLKARAGFRVTYDSKNGNEFVVEKPDGTTRTFKQSERGLYFMDTSATGRGVALINTVADNKSSYTNRDYSRAVLARQLQKIIGRPSYRTFLKIVKNNLLPNCPVTREDIIAAEKIFGPDVGSLKGKTVRRSTDHVDTRSVDIPADLMSQYREVTLAGDIMFVNKIPFFTTISRSIKFGTVEAIKDKKASTLVTAVKQVVSIYKKRGFSVKMICMDGEFEVLRGDLAEMGVTLNTSSNDEHVPEIERQIRTIKERTRCVYTTLPFTRMPARMIVEMVYSSNFWLNSFPALDGVSDTLSPRAMIVGTQIDYAKHCKLEFGTYVQTHEEHDNSMAERTTGAIALRPTGNAQGGYYFFSLTTGRVLNRNRWTALPMPAEVIDQVHVLARRNNVTNGLFFTDRVGNPIVADDEDDDDDDSSYAPSEAEDDDNDDDDDDGDYNDDEPNVPTAGVYGNNANNADDGTGDDNNLNDNDNTADDDEEGGDGTVDANNGTADAEDEEGDGNATDGGMGDDDDAANREEDQAPTVNEQMDQAYGARNSGYDLRPRRPRDYSHMHTTLESIVMTQYNIKKGIKGVW